MDREKIKILIELSQSVEEADNIVEEQGYKTIREKIAYVNGMFGVRLVGRFDNADVQEDQRLEMDYYAILSAIIYSKWEA